MNKTIALASLLALALGVPAAEAAKFYKWTDDNGVTHYTIKPPPAGAKSSQVRIKTQSFTDAEEPSEASSPGTGKKAAPKKGKEGKAGDAASDKAGKTDKEAKDGADKTGKYAEKCIKLRADLKTIQEYVRIRTTDEKGEQRTLTEEEKSDRKDDIERQIKAYCE